MNLISHYIVIFLLLTISLTARSGNQQAHTHGLATLTLALENDVLEIQFESPAANLVGFEHKATSANEKKAVTQAETTLKEPKGLFSFVGADCQSKKTSVDVSGLMGEQGNEHEEHEHHGHSEGHDESGHSEISAHYRFSCDDAKKLAAVSVALFNEFHGIEKIDVMWITEIKQGAVTLSANKKTISLR